MSQIFKFNNLFYFIIFGKFNIKKSFRKNKWLWFSWKQHCPGQPWAWPSAVPDITQLHLVNLWVVVIVYINTFLTKQYIVGSGSGCGIVPWRSRDFFHFFTHKKLSQDFACNKNIGFQISLKTSEFSTLFLHTLFGVQAPNKKDKKCFLSNKNIAGWKGRTVSQIFAIGCVNTHMSLFSPD